jgi:hypothetical protein
MATRFPTHYETLGLKPGAKHTDIGLAFNRLVRAQRKDDAPPDLKAETKLREAFEVLSDLERRAAYDEQLRAARLKPAFGKNHAAFAAFFVVAVAAGLYWYLARPVEAPATLGKPYEELLAGAIPAVGRLQVMDISGRAEPAGIAFTVEEGAAVTSCVGIAPTAQMNVSMGTRAIPARVATSDPTLGICRLEVPGAGTWPLAVSPTPPKAGDRVFATQLSAKGEVSLREGKVKAVKPVDGVPVVQLDIPLMPGHAGAPLLDVHGRVVAVANLPEGSKGFYVPIPAKWGETIPVAKAQVPEPAPEPEKKPQQIDDLGMPVRNAPSVEISPERRERLEKAFRPPPTVPDDI